MDTWGLLMWVSPFRYLRIKGYLLLPAAFRSLSRLSSALSAKASTLRSFLLDLFTVPIALETGSLHLSMFFLNWVLGLFSRMSWYLKYFYFHQFISLCEIFKVHHCKVLTFQFLSAGCFRLVETERFELLTPCLQGRCSPNWATPPFGILKLFCFNLAATCFPIPSPV